MAKFLKFDCDLDNFIEELKKQVAMGKGGTIVAREGLLNSLKDKFGKDLDKSILNEEIILDEDE